jgi:hypothetical protein
VERGYDPDTGQIYDPVAFAHWQKEEQRRIQEELARQPAGSVYDVFMAARTSLREWVDADENKELVVNGSLENIIDCPAVQKLLKAYLGYGPVMQEKLRKHLAFLVENRRKFYAAFARK